MRDVCREFGVSRKMGYKIFDRCKEHGLEALTDRSGRFGGWIRTSASRPRARSTRSCTGTA